HLLRQAESAHGAQERDDPARTTERAPLDRFPARRRVPQVLVGRARRRRRDVAVATRPERLAPRAEVPTGARRAGPRLGTGQAPSTAIGPGTRRNGIARPR